MAEIRLKSTGTIKLFENDNTSSVTIASPASLAADRTITLPDADVTLGDNTPGIMAGMAGSSVSIGSGSDTEILYDTIMYESPSSLFSTVTGRFTPAVTGAYWVYVVARINAGNSGGEFANLQIRVNGVSSSSASTFGTTYRRYQDDGNENSFAVGTIVNLTSTSDYISAYIYQNQGSGQNLQADHTTFSAYKLIT
jgi:hypothetical protein